MTEPRRDVAAVVLAAGQSRRLGRPKQLVRFRGDALVRRAARAALDAALTPVAVVIAPGLDDVRDAVVDLPVEIVENPWSASGVGTSVAAGVARVRTVAPSTSAIVLLACDQPLMDADHLRSLVATWTSSDRPVVASEYAGVRGVPALFAAEVFPELAALDGDRGAREVVRRDLSRVAGVPFPGGELDIDVEADVDRARKLER